jgi:hypothetical protein
VRLATTARVALAKRHDWNRLNVVDYDRQKASETGGTSDTLAFMASTVARWRKELWAICDIVVA